MPSPEKDDDLFEIAQAEHALAEAHLTLDLDTIDRLIHPGYIIVQPGGEVETKAEVLASYRTGTRRWDKAQVDQLDIRLHRDAAIVIGRWQASGQNGEQSFDYQARFLSVWVSRTGAGRTWPMRRQSSKRPTADPARCPVSACRINNATWRQDAPRPSPRNRTVLARNARSF